MSRRVRIWLAAFLVIGAPLAWRVLTTPCSDPQPGTLERDAASPEPEREGAVPVRLEGAARAARALDASAREDGVAEESVCDGRVVLRVEILGAGPERAVEVEYWIPTSMLDSRASLMGLETRSGDGKLVLDLTEYLRDHKDHALVKGSELRLLATAEGRGDATTAVGLPALDALLKGEIQLDPVRIHLRPASSIHGRVLLPNGDPADQARLQLHKLGADGPESIAVAGTLTDNAGGFELQVTNGGRYLLVGCWEGRDAGPRGVPHRARPEVIRLDLVPGRAEEGVEIRLREGHTIQGRVVVDGEAAPEATVGWRLAGEARPLHDVGEGEFDDAWLWWMDGCVHWAGDRVTADAKGRFRIPGASTTAYRVGVRAAKGAELHARALEPSDVEVTPPADEVTLTLGLSRLVLKVVHAERPLRLTSSVSIAAVGMESDLPAGVVWSVSTVVPNERGSIEIRLTPEHTYHVVIEEPGYAQWVKEITARPAGETLELVADLERAQPRPQLIVRLKGTGAASVEECAFGLYRPGVDPATQSPHFIRSAHRSEDGFLLKDLFPGRYALYVRPGRSWHGTGSDWLESRIDVDLPRSGESEVTVSIGRGGRLLIDAQDADGRDVACPCTLHGPDGNKLQIHFVTEFEGGGVVLSSDLSGEGPAWVDRALPPGRYEVTLEPTDRAPVVREVVIRVGQPTTLRIRTKTE